MANGTSSPGGFFSVGDTLVFPLAPLNNGIATYTVSAVTDTNHYSITGVRRPAMAPRPLDSP